MPIYARHNSFKVSKLVLGASAVPSLIKRSDFPCGLDKTTIKNIIDSNYIDRGKILENFSNIIFYQFKGQKFLKRIFKIGYF